MHGLLVEVNAFYRLNMPQRYLPAELIPKALALLLPKLSWAVPSASGVV